MAQNQLKLNDDKTEVIILGKKQQTKNVFIPTITIGDSHVKVNQEKSVRNLGVQFDPELTMINHLKSVSQSVHFHIRNIGSIRKYLTRPATESLVHSLVSSRIDYGNALLSGIPSCHLYILQKLQNTAARIITRRSKFSHVTPVLKDLHWLPIQARIDFKVLLLTYKILNGKAPGYLSDLISLHNPSRALRSGSSGLLTVPRANLKTCGSRAFCVAAPTLWNTIPQEIRNADTVSIFKSRLKTFLYNRSFSHI